MRKFIAVLAATVACGAQAGPASQESIERLLELSKAEAVVDSAYASMEGMMRQGMQQSVAGKELTPEQRRLVDAAPAKFAAVMRSEFNWAKMKPLYIQLYRDVFDQEEVDGLAAFYAGPVGQAFVNKMPVVMQKSMAMSTSMLQTLIPKLKEAMDGEMAEINRAQ